MGERGYDLEQLYEDQSPDLVVDTIPAVLAWVAPGSADRRRSTAFSVRIQRGKGEPAEALLKVRWDIAALAERDPTVEERARRMRQGTSAHREHLTEVAAYGLALIAISIWLPGRRALGWSKWQTPDLLLDATPGARRGVEVAGRGRGGFGALRVALEGAASAWGKRAALLAASDVIEAQVSLWCASPRAAMWVEVKP